MRLKSTAVWYDLPGVEAAYQSIAAPDPFAARQNVAHGSARFGVYTETPGVLPTWSVARGHTYNGSTQWLNTKIIPNSIAWTVLVRYVGATWDATARALFGCDGGTQSLFVEWFTDGNSYYANGKLAAVAGAPPTSGVIGVAGLAGYLNGVSVVSIPSGGTAATLEIAIGARRWDFGPTMFFNGSTCSVLIASRTLAPAEVWLASRQMQYCEQNPDWNAWARRRRYYYAPSAAARSVGIYGARGAVALPGGVRIGTVNDA